MSKARQKLVEARRKAKDERDKHEKWVATVAGKNTRHARHLADLATAKESDINRKYQPAVSAIERVLWKGGKLSDLVGEPVPSSADGAAESKCAGVQLLSTSLQCTMLLSTSQSHRKLAKCRVDLHSRPPLLQAAEMAVGRTTRAAPT